MAKRNFYIRETELDDSQVKVLQKRVHKSSIIEGCAGSGKSILDLHRVKQIQEEKKGSFYFILFTRALKQYMQDGIDSIGLQSKRVTYFWHWKNELDAPSADYIIIDEAQDFSKDDINLFRSKANKALILFGDSAQQIYKFKKPKPISMKKIITLTEIPSIKLKINYRLPKKIARLAEKIADSNQKLESKCKNEGVEMPKILKFENLKKQLKEIIRIVRNRQFDDVGILFRDNSDVQFAKSYFDKKGFNVEAKINMNMNIDFKSSNPKLLTYHSSKGLQFEAVFIPNCNVSDKEDRNPLYVAITRTYQYLFIMHSGDLSPFFNAAPKDLYETSLNSKKSRRL
jgi:superfamily I DNA/RNA helicase